MAVLALVAVGAGGSARAFLPPMPPDGRRLDPQIVERLEAAHDRGVAQGPATLRGDVDPGAHALVLLVDFADERWEHGLHPRALYDSLLFGHTGRTVRRYYSEISGHAFDLTGDVRGVTRLDVPVASYTGDGYCDGCFLGVGDYPHNAPRLVEDLVHAVDDGVDFSRYDGNGDGEVDILYVVHAGEAYEDALGGRRFLSHQWHTFVPPEVDGVRVTSYVLMSATSGVGGFAHETAHLFGVPDLYDLDGFAPSAGVGEWSLMAAGLRLGTPTYARPAHPDPWTRIQMGFATAVDDPFPGPEGEVRLSPVESGGPILRVWTGKIRGPEYFLLEHRSRTAGLFDTELPGSGLLVYHVDERVPSNRNPERYKVAVEQADGRFDLEASGPRPGDGGDPFPGDSLRARFDATTVPASDDHAGRPTGVRLTNIRQEGEEMVLTISIADTPWFEAGPVHWTEIEGDGDLRPEAGEAWWLTPTLENRGTDSGPLVVSAWLSATAPDGLTLSPSSVAVDPVTSETSVVLSHAFRLDLAPGLDPDPIPVPLRMAVASDARTDTLDVPLLAGDRFGLVASFESEDHGFTHRRVGLGQADPWHRTLLDAANGAASMRAGDEGEDGYPPHVDAVLESPRFFLGAGSTLRFRHRVDLELDAAGDAFDGARVEVVTDQGVVVVDPQGGYPISPVGNAELGLFDHDVWSGRTDWEEVTIDLSPFDAGVIALRFRMATDRIDEGGPYGGWWIDDIDVVTDDADAAVALLAPTSTESGVVLGFSLAENRRRFSGSLTLTREGLGGDGEVIDGPHPVASWTPTGSMRGQHHEPPLGPGDRRRYRLWRDEGTPLLVGETILSRPATPPGLSLVAAGPVPFRPAQAPFTLRLAASGGGAVTLSLYDATGRRVHEIQSPLDPVGPTTLTWDGHDAHGREVAPGVVFYRIESDGRTLRGRTLLLR